MSTGPCVESESGAAGAGPDYLDEQRGDDWAAKTGRAMARNLATVARALVATPMQPPPD